MNDNWRTPEKPLLDWEEMSKEIVPLIEEMRASALGGKPMPEFSSDSADSVVMDRQIRQKKGNWFQLPKDLNT